MVDAAVSKVELRKLNCASFESSTKILLKDL